MPATDSSPRDKLRLPIRTRLTLLFAVLVALVLLGTGAFVRIRVSQDLRSTVDSGLSSRAQELLAGVDGTGIQFGQEGNLIEPDAAFTQVVSPDGIVLESSAALGQRLLLPMSTIASLGRATYFDVDVRASGERLHARLLAAPSQAGPIIIVGASLEEQDEAMTRLTTALSLGGAGALAVVTFIGWLVAGGALRPVERMRAQAAEISADRPGTRLHVPETGDELARLSETLNDMLSRLEDAIEHERRFVDDASHELRTPLGILKTELELALRKARSPEELEAALRSAAEESDRLNSLAEDLLVLARSDRGRLVVRPQDTDISDLVREVRTNFLPVAESSGVTIDIDGSATRAAVDPIRLRQALSNLIDNSLRYSPSGSTIAIKTWNDAHHLHIEVADQGPGFPAEFLPRAFDPFARSDPGRTRSDGGAGLGLAIVLAIAEAHEGSARAENRDAGAVVTLTFPLRSS